MIKSSRLPLINSTVKSECLLLTIIIILYTFPFLTATNIILAFGRADFGRPSHLADSLHLRDSYSLIVELEFCVLELLTLPLETVTVPFPPTP